MPDIPLNPSTLVVNGELVSATNPLPVTSVAAGAPGTPVTLNPRTFVVNGEIVSATNPLPVTGISVGPDADTLAWQAAVIANGGTVSAGRLVIVNNFIIAEKAAGTWALTDDYFALWGENVPQALTSLKQRRLATAVAAPTFTADRGYAFNGTTQYLDTGFGPSTMAVAMVLTSARVAVYERTNVLSATYAIGGINSANRLIAISPRSSGTTANAGAMTTNGNYTLPAADSRGFLAMSRNDTVSDAYKNGVLLPETVNPTLSAGPLVVTSIFIGGYSNIGVLTSPRACSVGFACIGAALTAAQEAAQYANVQAWATAIGAQV
jgi:hypothetical protein